jgi:hypothetical protein
MADIAREVVAAGTLALNTLAKNSDCAGLFGLTPGLPDPSTVLQKLLGADPSVGMVIVNDITSQPGQVTSANVTGANWHNVDIGNGATQLRAGFVQVTINDLAGTFVTGSTQDQAVTLLHELGHVYADLFGPESSRIQDDATSLATSIANSSLVRTTCFH